MIGETNEPDFLSGGGEMGAMIRSLDWSQTPVGPPENWPGSLRIALGILLASGYPMYIAWGPEFVQFYNDAYRPILGATKHPRALGQSTVECFAEIWDFIGPMFHRALREGKATTLVDQMLPLDRNGYVEECYFTFSYSPIPTETGGSGGVFVTVIETTERVLSERRIGTLRELASVTAQARTTEQAGSLIATTLGRNRHDLPFTLLYFVDETETRARLVGISGWEPDQSASPTVLDLADTTIWPLGTLTTGDKRVIALPPCAGDLPSGVWPERPRQAVILPILLPGQEKTSGFLIAGISPRLALDDTYQGYLDLLAGSVATVISSARSYEEERKRAEALAELDRAKTVFFSNVSHEFRTPLTLMLGPLEDALARPEEMSSEHQRLLEVAHRNGMRLLKLVNTLLDFTRIEAGRVQARFTPTDLAATTVDLASVFRSAIEKAGMRLIIDCPPLSEPVYVDREMWEKIVLNLLSNAFKFTLEGEIEVRLRQQDDRAVLRIRDTGSGIAADQLPHIFERFHRVEGTRARTHEGTGIGLALVQELVRLHSGTISVESEYGKGTTFTLSLPLGQDHLNPAHLSGSPPLSSMALDAETYLEEALRWLPAEKEPTIPPPSLQAITAPGATNEEGHPVSIVLADDNADMREYVARLLRPRYRVIAVSDGEEALQATRAYHPDLILSDIMMPRKDGFQLLQDLRGDPITASIPVILLSARAGEEARIEGLSAGADDYLIKPFSARELLARVASHLDLARVRREAGQAIRASEERLRLAVENAGMGTWDLDLRTGRLLWSDTHFTLLGYSPTPDGVAEFALWEKCLHPEDRERVIEEFTTAQRRGALFKSTYRIVRANDGQIRWLTAFGRSLQDAMGESVRSVGIFFDDTERRQADENLINHQREIETLNIHLQRAMTETHHRVKNNLQLISALIDLPRQPARETVPVSELDRLSANVRALAVIHDILTQETKAGSDQGTLSVRMVLERLLESIQQAATERQFVCTIDDARLIGRQTTALALVTNELISNALKYAQGTIEIRFTADTDMATLEVCDDGPGFPPGFDVTTAANTGLELVENIVQWDLRGHTAFGNGAGGARVTVTFPLTVDRT